MYIISVLTLSSNEISEILEFLDTHKIQGAYSGSILMIVNDEDYLILKLSYPDLHGIRTTDNGEMYE